MGTASSDRAAKTAPPPSTVDDKTHKRRALIIAGYPCIGKTSFCSNEELRESLNLGPVVDLDSRTYPRDGFPANYLEAIRREADADADATPGGEARVVLVSTFPGVATQLAREGYYVAQVYPRGSAECRREWLGRLERREQGGRESRLYGLVSENWDAWCEEMEQRDVSHSVPISATDYLSDVMQEIHEAFLRDAQRGSSSGGAEAAGRGAPTT